MKSAVSCCTLRRARIVLALAQAGHNRRNDCPNNADRNQLINLHPGGYQHFDIRKVEYAAQALVLILERSDRLRERDTQGAQSEDRENIGRVDDERFLADR
jgi:hypothetical protein